MLYYGGISGYLFILPLIIYAMYAQNKVKQTFGKYLKVPNRKGMTGYDTARRILDVNGLSDVKIEQVSGVMSDHYDPRTRTVRLSNAVYSGNSITSMSVGAHEVGHAIQHANGYTPLSIRSLLAPVASFGSRYVMILVLAGFFFRILQLIDLGIIFYTFAVLFQIVTLPVEFNASKRAMESMDQLGLLDSGELVHSRQVLNAAAMTYVAATAVAAGQLLRLILLRNSRR